jgi:hypothetical protein
VNQALHELVVCDVLRGTFPRGVPRRACLRRQLELAREGKGWAPKHPSCAACPFGGQVRALVEAAGIVLGSCARHGSAIVGEDRCEACAGEAPERQERPPCLECGSTSKHAATCSRPGREPRTRSGAERASHPVVTLRGAPVSTVIWSEGAPDAPIAAPARRDVGLTPEDTQAAAARVRAALRRPTAVATPPPTTRADTNHEEEDVMPTGIRAAPCKGCGTKGSKHRQVNGKDCPERGKSAPSARAAGATKVVALRRPAPPRRPRWWRSAGPRRRGSRATSTPSWLAARPS